MNRIILILVLLGIGIYVYFMLFNNTNYFSRQVQQPRNNNIEFINDEFIEQPLDNKRNNHERHVHFSDKNTEHIIPNKNDVKINNLYDDIFIVDPIEIKNTNLTLSENEYFNN
jgi:hypothetical protein